MRSMQILLVGILTYASSAAARCVPNNPASCDEKEKKLLGELMALGRTELMERVRLERMEVMTIQNNARSDMERLQSEEIALKTGPQRQKVTEQRSLLLKERGEWEAAWSQKMSDLSKQQQESSQARGKLQSAGMTNEQQHEQQKEMQKKRHETQQYVIEQRRKLGQERAEYQTEFAKKMQELNSGGKQMGQNLQEELQAMSAKRAKVHKDSEEKMRAQSKIIELATLVMQQPPVGERVPNFMNGAKPSAGKPTGAGKPDAVFSHEGREAEL